MDPFSVNVFVSHVISWTRSGLVELPVRMDVRADLGSDNMTMLLIETGSCTK